MIKELLKDIDDIEVYENADLSRYSTIRLKSLGNFLIIKSISSLKEVLALYKKNNLRFRMVGLGANQVLEGHKDLTYIKLKLPFEMKYLEEERDEYILPASVSLTLLTNHAKKFCLDKWQFMTGIPATIGGAVFMNAGIRAGEVGEIVKAVKVMNLDGEIREVEITDNSFSYRKNHFVKSDEVIIEVTLKNCGKNKDIPKIIEDYIENRSLTQPWKDKTCGCVFKNASTACRAGHYIDILNLKGFSYKGITISHLHGNFFVNRGEADAESFIKFVHIVQEELYLQFGQRFEMEVQIV